MLRSRLIFSLLFAAALPLFAADPSEQFLSAYQSYQQAENLEHSGNTEDALVKFRFAESLLLAISKTDPSWQKPVVEYRLKKTRESIARLQGNSADSGGTDATLATPPPADNAPPAGNVPDQASPDNGARQSRSPESRSPSVSPSISITPPTGGEQRSSTGSSAHSPEARRLQRMVQDLRDQLKEANDALALQKSRQDDLEHAEWAQKQSQLTAQLDVAKRRISDLERDLKSRDSWGDQLKDLQKKLDDTVADKLAAEEQYQGNIKKLSDANALLGKQLLEARGNVTATAESKQKIEQLSREVEQGKEAYAQLQAKFDHSEQISKETLAKNDDLQKQLVSTTEKLASVQKLNEEAAPLKEKIKQLQAKVDQEEGAIKRESALQADVQVLEEDRARLEQKVNELGAAAMEASKVKGLTAQTESLQKTVADLKGRLDAGNKELEKAVTEAEKSKKLAEAARADAKKAQAVQAKVVDAADADREVLQEERERLMAKVSKASEALKSLKATADTVPALKMHVEQLQGQLSQNAKTLEESVAKLSEVRKAENAVREEAEKKDQAAKNVADLLTQQNKSLQDQLKEALGKIASEVDHSPDSVALQEQVKKLQEQVTQNAKNFADSQRQLTELAKTQPDQQKLLGEKQKALLDAQNQAAALQAKLDAAGDQIAALKKQREQGSAHLKELQDQLAARDAKIAKLKKQKGGEVDDQISQENELLRGIVLRQIKEEARKAQAHRLMEEELKRLNVQSDVLQQQMTELAAPALALTPEERALFKDAQLVVTDQGGESVEASVAAPMIASRNAPDSRKTVQEGKPDSTNAASLGQEGNNVAATNASSTLPWQGKFKELLAQAKEEFDRQDYIQAENTFQEALKLAPNDYFALSNYGVVEFQLGKMKEAEEALKKAADQSKDSSFALTTLGIVHYRQQRAQDAETVLRKAVAINDQDFTAHNYLGIVLAASGKGKAGESELMKAVEINPNYADAHFNLAVIYATGKPPAKMLAKKHYQKALELGSPPDASLDRMLQ